MDAESRRGTGAYVVEHGAGGAAHRGRQIEVLARSRMRKREPTSLVNREEARSIADLIRPSLWRLQMKGVVDERLRLLAVGMRPNHPDIELDMVDRGHGDRVRHRYCRQPPAIRPV